jgi:hypothetical protein
MPTEPRRWTIRQTLVGRSWTPVAFPTLGTIAGREPVEVMPVSEHEAEMAKVRTFLEGFVAAWDDHDNNDLFTTYRFATLYLAQFRGTDR